MITLAANPQHVSADSVSGIQVSFLHDLEILQSV